MSSFEIVLPFKHLLFMHGLVSWCSYEHKSIPSRAHHPAQRLPDVYDMKSISSQLLFCSHVARRTKQSNKKKYAINRAQKNL